MTAAARPMTDAERAKLCRSRRAMGVAVYGVEVGASVLNGLEIAGLLRERDFADSDKVAAALGKALAEWANAKFSSHVTLIARGRT